MPPLRKKRPLYLIVGGGVALRAYVNVTGYGTPLEEKNLSQNPVYPGGDDESFVKGKEDGFTPGENGYTVEFRVKTDNLNKVFEAFAVCCNKAIIVSDSPKVSRTLHVKPHTRETFPTTACSNAIV